MSTIWIVLLTIAGVVALIAVLFYFFVLNPLNKAFAPENFNWSMDDDDDECLN